MLKLLVVVVVLAVAIYVVIRQLQGGRPAAGPAGPPPRPLGPDDDPDFLRDLDRKRKQEGESEA